MAHTHGQRAWARARLTRGSSTGEVWEIGSEYPEARLSVGADASVGWLIQAPGVQPVHCELFWDGQSLWVADTYGVGGVFLDGTRVGEWVQIHGPAELRFGQAALDVETSAPAHEVMVSSPRDARPVTVTDMVIPERRSQPIFGGAAGDESIPELEAAATRVVASPVEVDAERTRIAPSKGAAAPAAPVDALRPRLGGAPTPHEAEATRMVAIPAKSAQPPPPPAHQPLAPAPVVAPPPPPVAPSFGHAPALPPAPPQQLPPVPDAVVPLAPGPMDSGAAFVGPPVGPSDAGPKKSPLAQVLEKLKPQSSADVLAASGGKKGQTIPTRTWIMLGVTLVAAVGLLLWEDEPAEVAAPQQQAAAQGGAVAVSPSTPTPPTPTPPTPPTPVVEPTPPTPTEPVAVTPTPTPAPTPSPTPAGGSQAPVGPSAQRQAADHYIHGRFREALTLYRQLAQESPDDAAYAAMVRILEQRVECVNGLGPGGQPCGN